MSLKVVDANLIEDGIVLIEFSDGTIAGFTSEDLIGLLRFLDTPDVVTQISRDEGITLCRPKLPIHLVERRSEHQAG